MSARVPVVPIDHRQDLLLPTNPTAHDLDPALLALVARPATLAELPIDPALFAIEQVVHDVHRGRATQDSASPVVEVDRASSRTVVPHAPQEDHKQHIEDTDLLSTPHATVPYPAEQHETEAANHGHGHVQPVDHDGGGDIQLDDGIDPALREIVNSLTNAQQSHHPNLSVPDVDERERERLQHTLQSTLDGFTHNDFATYGAIFNTNFPQSPSSHNLILPHLGHDEVNAHSETHNASLGLDQPGVGLVDPAASQSATPSEEPSAPIKRGRGRPKGSKNKPKPGQVVASAPPPRRPKGRPPKVRTGEELAEFERRQQEKAAGIARKRGRPRKYPEIGLVREMRLKKNRPAVQDKIRELEQRRALALASSSQGGVAEEDGSGLAMRPLTVRQLGHEQNQEHAHDRLAAQQQGAQGPAAGSSLYPGPDPHVGRESVGLEELDVSDNVMHISESEVHAAFGEQVAAAVVQSQSQGQSLPHSHAHTPHTLPHSMSHSHDHTQPHTPTHQPAPDSAHPGSHPEQHESYNWSYQDGQTLLDVVDLAAGVVAMGGGVGLEQGDDGMRGVFSLADVGQP